VLSAAALLGALLASVPDTLGRTVIGPGQLPAGLLAALGGTPAAVAVAALTGARDDRLHR
jgi:iron complex transport system permease protein